MASQSTSASERPAAKSLWLILALVVVGVSARLSGSWNPVWMTVFGVSLVLFSRVLARESIRRTRQLPGHSPLASLFGGEAGWLFFWQLVLVVLGAAWALDGLSELL